MQSNLGVLTVDPVHDGLIRRFTEPALGPRSLVLIIPLGQPFGAIIISIPKRLMDTLNCVSTGHEHLEDSSVRMIGRETSSFIKKLVLARTPSNRIEGGWQQRRACSTCWGRAVVYILGKVASKTSAGRMEPKR